MADEGILDPLGLFFMAWRGFVGQADNILAKRKLGRVHHRVLYTVARMPGVSVGDLAASLGISRQALHRPLPHLLDQGFVRCAVASEARRVRELSLTAAGRKLEEQVSATQIELLKKVLKAAGPEASEGWFSVMWMLADPVLARAPAPVRKAFVDMRDNPRQASGSRLK
ncbi:MAG: MarR family winged helix-turn-helix transcriptional regulator [Leptospirales bacterium]